MNSISILEQFVVKGKGVSEHAKLISTIVVIIVAFALAGLIAYLIGSVGAPAIAGAGDFTISQNPELLVAQRYAADVAARGETLFEIQNPELNLVMRLQEAGVSEGIVSDYPNPEVFFASRFAPDWVENPELNLLSWYENYFEQVSLYKNPELMVAGRYAGSAPAEAGLTIEQKYAVMGVEVGKPLSIYANPELGVARRFAGAFEPVSYSSNPELMVAERFAQAKEASAGLTIEQKYAVMGVEIGKPLSIYANPELGVASRFAAAFEPVSYSSNPELMVAERFAGISEPVSLYPNPELTLAQRYAVETGAGSQGWVLNPELALVQRYAVELDNSAFLETNPEIKQHLRFIQGG